MRKAIAFVCLMLVFVLCFTACGKNKTETENYSGETNTLIPIEEDTESTAGSSDINYSDMDTDLSKRDSNADYSESSAVKITFNGSKSSVNGNGASADGADVTVTKAGTYLISGSSDDGSLTVAAGDSDKIQLVFNGLSLTNKDGVAVYIKSADKVFITLSSGSKNTLQDGSSYSVTDGDTALDAALFSRSDLTVNGNGALTVKGNCKHAIVSKDDLVVVDSTINVTAANVGLNGKDCVKIKNATLDIKAGSDGIRSDNDEDANRGFIYIYSGKITVNAGNDGIQAETLLQIDDVNANIVSGEGSANASWNSGGSWNNGWGSWGSAGSMQQSQEDESEASAKGIKAGGNITINGGNITVDSSDDCIHSNSNITVKNGDFKLSSGDDGIHADTALNISGGEFSITKSYEGLEATDISITGGNIDLIAEDDGINAAGGNDSSAMQGRPGQGHFSSTSGSITIGGGYILIDATGDGVDSNGTIDIKGGALLINGPTGNGNCAFDHDGTASVSGGVVIAVGSAGMAEAFNNAENQGALYTAFNTQSAGTSIALCDNGGKVVAAFTPTKAYQSAVITAPKLQKGSNYTIVAGAKINKADKNGYAVNTTKTGGSVIAEIIMSDWLYGSSGSGFAGGGFGGGMGRR